VAIARIRIEVRADVEGGWSVIRNCIVDGHFNDVAAANDYASACAQRARRAGMAVSLDTAPIEDAAVA
jgi:cyanophycinase-like exopeptidase